MEPDGTTRIAFTPDTAAGIKAMLAKLTKELGETPMSRLPPLPEARPKNWRPWHQHTLPNRRRR